MIVVYDASPLIALAHCDALFLFEHLFVDAYLSKDVFDEITVESKPFASDFKRLFQDNVIIQTSEDYRIAINIEQFHDLDLGERSAIELYYALDANYLLMDEKKGRKVARELGIHLIGSLGILSLAKQLGYIELVKPYTDRLLASPVFIHSKLVDIVLKNSSEL